MDTNLQNLLLGFVAAAISVVCVHQAIVLGLNTAGIWPAKPWSMAPVPPYDVPTIFNQVFWGGLWGVLLALVYASLPGDAAWLKGLLFGLFIFIVSNCVALPLIKGQALFYGFDPMKLISVGLILSGFGAATAVIYSLLTGKS